MTTTTTVQPKVLIGLQEVGPSSFNVDESSGQAFGEKLWYRFIDVLVKNSIGMDQVMYGVSWPADDQIPPQMIHYFCGIEFDSDIEGLTKLDLEGGNYFDYKCEVDAKKLDDGFRDAYMDAFPASGFVGRVGQHIELYEADYDPTSEIAKFHILIPVE